ncbi:Ubiquinone/menaquinone biosynthesis C-methyltransferase UbiE [anaerobic digester metagenome]
MDEQSVPAGFGDVDRSGASADLIAYLRFVNDLPQVRGVKDRSRRALGLRPGDRVLDAGTGVGLDAGLMGAVVGPTGRVLGVDASREMIAAARATKPQGLSQVWFALGDAVALPCPDRTFDAVHAERLLQVHPEPTRVVTELARVLRPAGRLVLVEPDWGTMAIDPGAPDVLRRVARHCAGAFPDGWTGRKLGRHLRAAGLVDVRVEPEVVVLTDLSLALKVMNLGPFIDEAAASRAITGAEREELLATLARADREGSFFFAMTTFRAVGVQAGEEPPSPDRDVPGEHGIASLDGESSTISDPLALDILDHLSRIVALGAAIDREPVEIDGCRLSASELHLVDGAGQCPGAGLSAHAARLGVTKGAVTQMARRLEEKGCLVRVPDPGDRRGVQLALTATGRRAFAWHRSLHDRIGGDLRGALDRMGPEERERLLAFFDLVEAMFEESVAEREDIK